MGKPDIRVFVYQHGITKATPMFLRTHCGQTLKRDELERYATEWERVTCPACLVYKPTEH